MSSNDNDVWFKCNECNIYFQGTEKAKKDHLIWGHKVRKRVPVNLRIVHKVNEDISPYLKVKVENNVWHCFLQLYIFKTDEAGETYFLTKNILNTPLANIIKQLNHLFPDQKITEKQLTKLLKQAILRNNYEEINKDTVKIFLTLDSWLKLQPKNEHSKLIVTSRSKIRRLQPDEDEQRAKAIKNAKKWRR